MSEKYPRTWHLPFSPGGTNDDKRLINTDQFLNVIVSITEKMDGSNVCLERDNVYARSHGQPPVHISFDMLKSVHARVKHKIPKNWQVFGEWMFAKHSIKYNNLPHYLLLFAIRDIESGKWLKYDQVILFSRKIGVGIVPLLYVGSYKTAQNLKRDIESWTEQESVYGTECEGIVIRLAREYSDEEFPTSVAKWVRPDHVQTDRHWKNQKLIKNELKSK